MKTLGLAFYFIMTLFITSCQVKEKSSDGGLISGHTPTTNKFTLQTPTAKAYDESEIITFTVTFPFDIIMDATGGDPRLRITVGAATRYADYDVSPNAKTMTFKYTVAAGENDTNGIDVNALELNGSTLKFDNNGTITDCAIATVTTKNFPNVKVDTAGPVVSAFSLTNLPANYHAYQKLNFSVTFNEPVYASGTPEFRVYFHAAAQPAPQIQFADVQYVSGSGTNVLTFSYEIEPTLLDTNGFSSMPAAIDIGADTLQDANGNDANLSLASFTAAVQAYSNSVKVWGQYPNFVSITVPANATYIAGETLEFTVKFDRTVNVTGVPYLGVTIGSTLRQAQYFSGTGTDSLTFRYTAVPGDVDADGISVATSLTQNSGDITDTTSPNVSFFVVAANNALIIPSTTGIKVNAIQPQATAVARNTDITNRIWPTSIPDDKWNIGQVLNVTIGFNTPVKVDQTIGTPSIELVIGSTTVEAPYVSGTGQSSLIFRYTIQEGDLDTDGTIALGTIQMNGGNITDIPGTNVLLTLPASGIINTQIDGVRPVINSLTPPANRTYSTVVAMPFVVNWSEAVHYMANGSIAMDAGGLATPLVSNTGTSNDSATITHQPTLTGRNDADGVVVSSPLTAVGGGALIVKDQAGNDATNFTFPLPATAGLLVDTVLPTVTSIVPITANGTYRVGETLDFTVTFSEAVTTNVTAALPCIVITMNASGAGTECLRPTANTTNTVHTFRYTIAAADNDNNGVAVATTISSSAYPTATGYARDAGDNRVSAAFASPNTTGILIDNTAPAMPTATSFAGTHESGETLSFVLTYSEPMFVTGGTPYIRVALASGNIDFPLTAGDGTTTLTFSYTLTGADYDFDGLAASVNTITLNGATILDGGRNPAAGTNTFGAQNLSAVRIVFPNTNLWVKSDFVSLAKAGSPGVVNNGTHEGGSFRNFDGNDSLEISGALNNVETVFIVFQTPAAVVTQNMLRTRVVLDGTPGTVFDLTTALSTLNLDGVSAPYTPANTNHATGMATSTNFVLQVDFDSPEDFTAGVLIDTGFGGKVAEVMAISGTLTGAQKTIIRNYLDSTY